MNSRTAEAPKIKLSCRIDNLAIPEICTGAVEERDDFEDCGLDDVICYDTVAVPEVHFSRCVGPNCKYAQTHKHPKMHEDEK